MKQALTLLATLLLLPLATLRAADDRKPSTQPDEVCYLFSYFLNNGQDGLHLAWSADGLKWTVMNRGKSYLKPEVGGKLMRDPCLLLGPEDTFQLVWTDSWGSRTIGHASSKDLIHWSPQQEIPVMAHEPKASNCWAPEIIYEEVKQEYVIFWSTTIPGRFPKTDGTGDGRCNHRIYCTTTKDFKAFTPTRLFYDGGFNVIDATMLRANGKFHLIVKDETKTPVKKNLRMAVGDSAQGPFKDLSDPFTPSWVEGPTAIRLGEDYVIYFDCYTKGRYGAIRSRDLKTWEDISGQLAFVPGARHGTVLKVSRSVVDRLLLNPEGAEANAGEIAQNAGFVVSEKKPKAFTEPSMYFGDATRLGRPFAKDPSASRFGGHYLFYQGNNDQGRTWFLSWVKLAWDGDKPRVIEQHKLNKTSDIPTPKHENNG